ncbi:type II secretion system minor pseudopilin GspJ [Ectothiorhodospiraceae bacterium WFHF3C12]|nr:type II secretion system minor pseudopilin GspJ [Ectothiorhodospiraceae bacterium WFHF3C12]
MIERVRQSNHGFTLLEVIVAVAIFAVVSAVAYGGLNAVLNTQSQTRDHAERLTRLQRALTVMAMDFEQAVPRPIRDQYGDPEAAMLVNVEGIAFTRAGQLNPMGQARSAFERVGYRLDEEGNLIRVSWRGLDQPIDPVKRETRLLEGVDGFSVEFAAGTDSEWLEQWPPLGVRDPMQSMPIAVRITLELPDYGGEIIRILRVPAG